MRFGVRVGETIRGMASRKMLKRRELLSCGSEQNRLALTVSLHTYIRTVAASKIGWRLKAAAAGSAAPMIMQWTVIETNRPASSPTSGLATHLYVCICMHAPHAVRPAGWRPA